MVKCTKVSEVNIPNNATSTWSLSFTATDFPEIVGLMKNFERGQFLKQTVRVCPLQNVSNNSTSQMPGYCIFPWHSSATPPASKPFTSFMSIDKAKYRHQTQGVKMSFVPVCRSCDYVSYTTGTPGVTNTFGNMQWRPDIPWNLIGPEIDTNPRIYTGCIAFQGDPTAEGRSTSFNIIEDVWVLMKNQSSLYL